MRFSSPLLRSLANESGNNTPDTEIPTCRSVRIGASSALVAGNAIAKFAAADTRRIASDFIVALLARPQASAGRLQLNNPKALAFDPQPKRNVHLARFAADVPVRVKLEWPDTSLHIPTAPAQSAE